MEEPSEIMLSASTSKRCAKAASLVDDRPSAQKKIKFTELVSPGDVTETEELKKSVPPTPIDGDATGEESNGSPYASEADPNTHLLADYMEKVQKDITPNMRAMLVDYLVDVAEEFKMQSETLFLTVSCVDRFLSKNTLRRTELQLLGLSSMFIAWKYEETRDEECPARSVQDFCEVSAKSLSREQVLEMEINVLHSINHELSIPTAVTFLRRFLTDAKEKKSLKVKFLCFYLAELSLLEYDCLKFLPSMLAASIIFFAKWIITSEIHPWTLSLQNVTKYSPPELKQCVFTIHKLSRSEIVSTFKAKKKNTINISSILCQSLPLLQ